MDFSALSLPVPLMEGLAAGGITQPTPIQELALPVLCGGRDAILQAETGTGKTLAYLLPLFAQPVEERLCQLVLTPTRELAMQVHNEAQTLAQRTAIPLRSLPLFAGVNIAGQIERLKQKPQIVVGTAARIRELIRRRKLPVHQVKTVVLDEADKLLEDSFRDEVLAVLKSCPRDAQRVLVSASLSRNAMDRAAALCRTPAVLRTADGFSLPASIRHLRIAAGGRDKLEVLLDAIRRYRPRRAMVFLNTPEEMARALAKLREAGLPAASLSGGDSQQERRKALTDFRTGKQPLLIASDLAARGLHIGGVDMLFHVTLPESPLDYLHRAGRTGRGGEAGVSVVLAKHREWPLTAQYERALHIRFEDIRL